MNWDLGEYDHVAAQLSSASEVVVAQCDPQRHEHIIDLGCGTGNAALLLARNCSHVRGVDPSSGLLQTARARALTLGLDIEFLDGLAESIPADDRSIDAIVSVFGLIFSNDAPATASEIDRVLRPQGRCVFSAWLPEGALAEQSRIRRVAVANALGLPASPAPFAWHNLNDIRELFAPFGFSTIIEHKELEFSALSTSAYLDAELDLHPLWVEAKEILEPLGSWNALREQVREIFTEANENPDAFAITSRYIVATVTR